MAKNFAMVLIILFCPCIMFLLSLLDHGLPCNYCIYFIDFGCMVVRLISFLIGFSRLC